MCWSFIIILYTFYSCIPNTIPVEFLCFSYPLFCTCIPFLFLCFIHFLYFSILCSNRPSVHDDAKTLVPATSASMLGMHAYLTALVIRGKSCLLCVPYSDQCWQNFFYLLSAEKSRWHKSYNFFCSASIQSCSPRCFNSLLNIGKNQRRGQSIDTSTPHIAPKAQDDQTSWPLNRLLHLDPRSYSLHLKKTVVVGFKFCLKKTVVTGLLLAY